MRAAETPHKAPQPEPSLSIVGWSIHRIIWLLGPWYSAIPIAWLVCSKDSFIIRDATPAIATATQAPEV